MEGIKTGNTGHWAGSVVSGVSVEIDHEQIAHVNTLLQSVPQKALVVYERAIRRGLSAGRTQANKEIKERYDISSANLDNEAGHTYKTYQEKVSKDGGGVVGYINFAGAKIPLYRFHPSPGQRTYTTRYVNGWGGWRVTTDVSAADLRGQMLRRQTAFIATFKSGHTGIFTRTGKTTRTGKDKIREYWGFSVQDMLDYPPAREAVQERMAEIVARRIDHELLQMLD